ncbi:putative outer membrane protein [Methylophaga aminisulfidivorans MP]|uniref:Putative outer membrane protein n=1 Tax=Methylophaga aminisulfidivorans MP TaxID=1026882 RepID=F5T085_9GAMM|nr:TolC family protein [Methylophaga aminisulfidivorans]EGL55135.1 putative outer membrane protein [Methylophaga aminisulfidivorans MP]
MRRYTSYVIAALIGTLSPVVSFAEDSETVSSSVPYAANLDLASLTDKVYQRLPGLLAEDKYRQLLQANDTYSQALFAEPVTGNLSLFSDEVGTGHGFQEWEGGVDLPLWLPGQKQQQQALSDKIAAELPAYQQALKLEASGEVRQQIWQVKLAEAQLEQAKLTWENAKKLQNDVESRVKAGDLASTERLLASSNTLEAHSKMVNAESQLQQRLKIYQLITGENALPQQVEEAVSNTTQDLQQHPQLQLQDQLIARLQAQMGLAQYDGAVNPSLSVGVRRERGDRAEDYTNSMGIGFSMALDDKAYRQPAIAQASAELADAQVARQSLWRQLKTRQVALQEELNSSRQQLDLITEQNKTTQQYYQLQKRAFDLGEINLIDLLRSQALANDNESRKRLLEVQIKQQISELNQSYGMILSNS